MTFDATLGIQGLTGVVRLQGAVTDRDIKDLRAVMDAAVAADPQRLVIDVREVTSVVSAALRCLVFSQQRLPAAAEFVIEGASSHLQKQLRLAGLDRSMTIMASMPLLAVA